jgi:hypothetical protein
MYIPNCIIQFIMHSARFFSGDEIKKNNRSMMINGPFSIAMLNHRTHISGTPSLGVPLQSWGSSIQTSGWNPMVAMVAPASTI